MITETITWVEVLWQLISLVVLGYAARGIRRYVRLLNEHPEPPAHATAWERFREGEITLRVREKLVRAVIGLVGFLCVVPIGFWSWTMPSVLVINPFIVALIGFELSFCLVIVLDERNLDRRVGRIRQFEESHPLTQEE